MRFYGILASIFFVVFSSETLLAYSLFHYDFPPLANTVGTEEVFLIDESRQDPHEINLKRELVLRIWYPAIDDPKKDTNIWGYNKRSLIVQTLSKDVPFPNLFIDLMLPSKVRSKSRLASIDSVSPLILLLPGLGGGPIEEYTSLGESLAANGYFVIAVEFPFGVSVSQISQQKEPVKLSKELTDILQRYSTSKGAENIRQEVTAYRQKEHRLWIEDLKFLTKELKISRNPLFKFIDIKSVSIIGHSHGGMVALDACLQEENCKGSINFDGWTRGLEFPKNLKKHLLLYSPSTNDPSRGISFSTFCEGKENCSAQEIPNITKCDPGHSGIEDFIYLKWPLTYMTKNQCVSRSVEAAESIHKRIISFLHSN